MLHPTIRTSGAAKVAGLIALIGLSLALASAAGAQTGAPKTDDEKAFYAIGTALAGNLQQFKPISDRELELVVQGLRDVVGDKVLAVEQQEGGNLIRTMMQARQEKSAQLEASAATAFLTAEAAKSGAKKTASGLIITQLKPGNGATPAATDKVRVHYHGTLRDGTVFDSSVDRGQPAEFALNRVIPCWTEGVALMKVGGKARLVCPASIAYGNRGAPPRIMPGAALAFEVELLEIVKK
ncbi:MAG: FKBP-type peptidyl-prolyl cis-trans isomerase [Deltaproteobacteria bacterium]|nr:FKBP-type peptidyl-prolyl cis-trans isomerase [Deltaproteobacteria bacterium]